MSACRWEAGVCQTRLGLLDRAQRAAHEGPELYVAAMALWRDHHCTPVEVPPAGELDSQASGPAPSAGAPHAVAYGRCVDAIEAYARASISLGRPDAGSVVIQAYTDARRACYAALDAMHDLTPVGDQR